jgi:ATP-dependent RNA helicase RhlE
MQVINRRKSNNKPANAAGRYRSNKPNNGNKKNKRVSTLDPKQLINKSVQLTEEQDFIPNQSYEQLPININLKANLLKKGFVFPTQIQEETLAHLNAGKDLIGIANTGTGKTGAFLIPMIDRLLEQPKSFKTLVVVPTRELAVQVEQEFLALADGLNIHSACFIGGTNVQKDVAQLRRRKDLIIGTPGRLIDLANRGDLQLADISNLILDEFDRMLDMGFKRDIKKMVDLMPQRKQTILFSATVDNSQKSLIDSMLKNPVEVKVNAGTSASERVEQDIIRVPQGADKFKLLTDMMYDADFEKVLIFTETKRQADKLSKQLNNVDISADQIHGNKSQNYRNRALDKFKAGKVRVLVATDVAARGIDVSNISHVINYQLPLSFDSYVHRIGRTGRAGKLGKAFTFVD